MHHLGIIHLCELYQYLKVMSLTIRIKSIKDLTQYQRDASVDPFTVYSAQWSLLNGGSQEDILKKGRLGEKAIPH